MKIYNKIEDTYIYPDTIRFRDLWLGIEIYDDSLFNVLLFKIYLPVYAIKITSGKFERPFFVNKNQFDKIRDNIENNKDVVLEDYKYHIGIEDNIKDILNSKIDVMFLDDFSLEMEKDFKEKYLKGATSEDFFKMILDLIPVPKDNKNLYKLVNKIKNKKSAEMKAIYWDKNNCSCSRSYITLNSL